MTTTFIDEISPPYMREQRLDLTLDPDSGDPRAFQPIAVVVSYEKTKPDLVMLPLILEIQGPSPGSYQRREFTHDAPTSLVFVPKEGGRHLVVLREVAHNRWWGSIRLTVEGELLEPPRAS